MRRAIVTVLAMATVFSVCEPALAEPLKITSQSPPVQPGVRSFVLHSDRIGRDFAVTVNTPWATAFLPGQKFPAIYALDSGYGVAGPQGALLGGTGAMAPAIIVSVGYLPGQDAFRDTDLFHKKNEGVVARGGGGAAFEAFLLEDLKPFIEAKYPADPARSVLFGHSAAGLFTANVFADKPNAFAGYIIGSPPVWADPAVVAAVARAALQAKGVRVYLAAAELEYGGELVGGQLRVWKGYDKIEGLAEALKNRPGIALKTQFFAGETHLAYYPQLVTDGFPFALPPRRPANYKEQVLTDAAVARYAGDYTLPDGRTLTLRHHILAAGLPPDALEAQVTGVAPVSFLQNGKDQFYAPGADLEVTFDKSGLTLTGADGGTLRAERAKAP